MTKKKRSNSGRRKHFRLLPDNVKEVSEGQIEKCLTCKNAVPIGTGGKRVVFCQKGHTRFPDDGCPEYATYEKRGFQEQTEKTCGVCSHAVELKDPFTAMHVFYEIRCTAMSPDYLTGHYPTDHTCNFFNPLLICGNCGYYAKMAEPVRWQDKWYSGICFAKSIHTTCNTVLPHMDACADHSLKEGGSNK